MQTSGSLLKQFRERKGMSQVALAEKIGSYQNTISGWEADKISIDPRKLGDIDKALELTAQEQQQLLVLRLPAFDPEWLDKQPQEKRAGLLLSAYRERKGLLQEMLGERLGVHHNRVSYWETGTYRIDAQKFEDIAKVLELTPEETKTLILHHNPKLEEDWLANHFAMKNWQFINFPALDPEWLNQQPDHERAGLLLAAYRERKDMWQETLAEKIGTTHQTVSYWEMGTNSIDISMLGNIAKVLELTPEEQQQLLLARLPALDPEWLDKQPQQDRRAGLLLTAYRERKGIMQETLGEMIGVSKTTISQWERGNVKISPKALEAMAKHLALSTAEEDVLYARVDESNRVMKKDIVQHLKHKEKTGPFTASRQEDKTEVPGRS